MTKENHKPGPVRNEAWPFSTGYPARAIDAQNVHDQFRWLLNWVGQRQVFSFMGPGPYYEETVSDFSPYRHINPDYDYGGSPYFSIITKSEDLTTDPLRPHALGGLVIPWRYDAGATLTWTRQGGSPIEIWSAANQSHIDINSVTYASVPSQRIYFGKQPREMGLGTGGFGVQTLAYSKLMVAGLGVWTMPDFTPLCMSLDEFTLIQEAEFSLMRQIRGEAGTDKRGLGHLIGALEELKFRTSRCLLQSGHPTGIYTTSADYVDIRNGRTAEEPRSEFQVRTKRLYSEATVPTTPAVVAWAPGASVEDPAKIKFTVSGTEAYCEINVTSGTEALYTAPAGLDVNFGENQRIKIEFKTASGGSIAIRTYSLWEDE